MSKIIVECGDCDKEVKEKDCVKDEVEGYVCFRCLEKREAYIKNDLRRWML